MQNVNGQPHAMYCVDDSAHNVRNHIPNGQKLEIPRSANQVLL